TDRRESERLVGTMPGDAGGTKCGGAVNQDAILEGATGRQLVQAHAVGQVLLQMGNIRSHTSRRHRRTPLRLAFSANLNLPEMLVALRAPEQFYRLHSGETRIISELKIGLDEKHRSHGCGVVFDCLRIGLGAMAAPR